MNDTRYFSFLLRLWVTADAGRTAWRVLLEDTRTGDRLRFSSLQRLVEFLEDQGVPEDVEQSAAANGSVVRPGGSIPGDL